MGKKKLYRILIYAVVGTIGLLSGIQVSTYQTRVSSGVVGDDNTTAKMSDFFGSDSLLNMFSKSVDKPNLAQKYSEAKSVAKATIGWIYVENTRVNYPIMHGENNYYLNRAYDGSASASGSIFLDENETGFSKVNIIHGHNMLNGSMFTDLHNFYRVETQKENNKIYIYDGKKERVFSVISVMRVPSSYNLKMSLSTDSEVNSYAQELANQSVYNYGNKVTSNPLVILNTCFSDGTNDHLLVVGQEEL